MTGHTPGLPEMDEAEQTERKIWRHFFVYRICSVFALTAILFYSIAVCVSDSTYSLGWIAALVTAPAIAVQILYLYRFRSTLHH